MTIANSSFTRPAASHRAVAPARTAAPARPRIGRMGRLVERLTRRWTIDLYDIDLQLESADLEYELRHGRR